MQRFSKYIYLPLTIFFIISAVSLALSLVTEGGTPENFFSGISLYAASIGVFLVSIHIVILILSFIVKNLNHIYLLLKYTFIMSAIGFLLAWLGGEGSFFGDVFSGISFYGTLICIYLFPIHLVGVILSFVLRNNSKT
jgi:hypothetical protein